MSQDAHSGSAPLHILSGITNQQRAELTSARASTLPTSNQIADNAPVLRASTLPISPHVSGVAGPVTPLPITTAPIVAVYPTLHYSSPTQQEQAPLQTPPLSTTKSVDLLNVKESSSFDGAEVQSWRGCLRKWIDNTVDASLKTLRRHYILISFFFLIIIFLVSFAVGYALRLSSFDASQNLDEYISKNADVVSMAANLISVDSDSQTMTLDWFVTWNCTGSSCGAANIYFDQSLLRTGSTGTYNNTMPPPVFVLNYTDYNSYEEKDYRTNSPIFRTVVAMTNFYGGRSAQSYPFDKYTATLVLFAQTDNGTAIPIDIWDTTGIAVGFNAKLETAISGTAMDDVLVKNLTVTRGQVIRMYAIMIVISVWIVTLVFVMTCITGVLLGKGVRSDVLVLPVASLFAFTSLRTTMPGAPDGFGADIDFVGILPCLALLTLTSTFMAGVFLFRDPEHDAARWRMFTGSSTANNAQAPASSSIA